MNVKLDRKWLIGGSIGAAVVIVLAVIAWQVKSIDIPLIGNNGDVSFSDSTLCSTWLADHDSADVQGKFENAQYAYLEDRLHIPDALDG